MSEFLPTPYQQFYVYTHKDPATGEIVYVGKGTRERAWICRGHTAGGRSAEHAQWLNHIHERGYTMLDVVSIVESNMEKSPALKKELEMIDALRPLFNKNFSYPRTAVSKAEACAIRELYSKGQCSMSFLANSYGTSTMTIQRIISGKTKGYRE